MLASEIVLFITNHLFAIISYGKLTVFDIRK